MKTDVTAFLQESIQRLKQKSPKFFNVWSKINSVLLLIAGIPTIMAWMDMDDLNRFLPDSGVRIALKVIAFAALYGKFQNKLTVQSNHEVIITDQGVIQKPCGDLPFTEKKEEPKMVIGNTQNIKS